MKNSLGRIDKWLGRFERCYIFIIPQLHAKVKDRGIRLASKVISMLEDMIKFSRVTSIVNVYDRWGMDRLTALSSFHDSFILSIIGPKIRMHGSFKFHGINKPNICVKSCCFIFETWVLQVCIYSNWCKFLLLILFFLVFLSFLDSKLESRVPFFSITLEERGWALISRCLRFYWSGSWSAILVKLHTIRDSQAASENFICKYRFRMWFVFPLNNRFLNLKELTLSLVSYFWDE